MSLFYMVFNCFKIKIFKRKIVFFSYFIPFFFKVLWNIFWA
ncbi:371R [Invertebrate iridescent virus Kaz2018]|uniref:371R n=1 Tax=Invertebrate iridescent virus 6 TaxID=176652 RepID=Q91FF3_IIV6|nr:371R [Invertebrate iridescent virus 6]AAK82231.1 371R [Invertebrate iridescent virus 6]QMS79618.1 hypothetical protein IIV6-T1_364 [Invertebrate iridescent virus 6]QNH08781.1 371R [Invertebrate iridescent virus Kaz2018]